MRTPGGWASSLPGTRALAAQLRLGSVGVMVQNVFKDSPADRAGLERYDVIFDVDGKEVERGWRCSPATSATSSPATTSPDTLPGR